MKKIWTLKKHFILSLLIGLLIIGFNRLFLINEAASIGIIGGADGPTVVFVANSREEVTSMMKLIILLTEKGIFNGILAFIISLGLYKPVKIVTEKILGI
ncbi:MAG: sodium ion-translocating decarboxylase subunit beta [Anaeromicrobium sp.]|jgi:hypothetical protein|uniref:sodium ion-translocating decarboxylase subunit beta n=1 Tax=Anaeromicrobium sp. TaxID=1929132 RepID=UPI0025F41414|nr:sodium ion-translocating decarboxylase subunit beta [Anaeromicrobium sp.]MCT4594259.1 sodium ion-translocating decarboxylase subunit beta [Anaeromicrobium sp.]